MSNEHIRSLRLVGANGSGVAAEGAEAVSLFDVDGNPVVNGGGPLSVVSDSFTGTVANGDAIDLPNLIVGPSDFIVHVVTATKVTEISGIENPTGGLYFEIANGGTLAGGAGIQAGYGAIPYPPVLPFLTKSVFSQFDQYPHPDGTGLIGAVVKLAENDTNALIESGTITISLTVALLKMSMDF